MRPMLLLPLVLLLSACVSSHPTPPRLITGLPDGMEAPPGHLLGNPLPVGVEARAEDPMEDGVTLVVEASGVYDTAGAVGLALYDSAADFAADRSVRMIYLRPRGGRVTWEVQGLPKGTYAVRAWQDWNGDARLATGFMGRPREPYGYSKNAVYRNAPPAWGAVAFDVDHVMNHASFRLRPPY